jgi:putative ABC transport system permease protein
MSWLSRLVNVVRGSRLDRDLDEEIQFHLEARTDEFLRAGLSAEDARRRARQQFGNALLLRESSRDIKLIPRLDAILRDIGFAFRLSRRNKVVTGAAIISLSLAIGACAAAFALIDALILRPLPVDDPQSLIHLGVRAPADTRDGLSFNYPLFVELRNAGRAGVRLFAMSDQSRRDATFDDRGGATEKVYGQWISGDALTILGVKPALGRLLLPSDDVNPGQHPVAIVSYDFWTRRFGGRPDVLGRWVTIREKSLQIVGVTEQGFTGVEPGIRTDLWAPTMMWDERAISSPDTRWFRIWGRLQHGTAAEQMQPVLQTVFTRFQREQAATRPQESRDRLEQFINTRVYLRSAANGPSGLRENFAGALWVFAGIAFLVLLIACANVASLLVARATAREREMALRVAIGAGRGRLIQQVLIESGLLALASCTIGALLAAAVAPKLVSLLSTSRTLVHLDLGFDWRLLAFLAGAACLVTFLFGVAPAFRASAVLPGDALKSATGRHTPRIGLFRPLVAAQVAFSFVVLFVAGLCLTSFVKLLRTDLGFDQTNLALARVAVAPLPQGSETVPPSWRQLLERLEQTPGIESASLSGWGLFEGTGRNKSVRIPGRAVDAYTPWFLPVSPDFLQTMRIPLLAGRDFDWRDGQPEAPPTVIVNESFARRYFPGESPLGKRFFRIDGGATLVEQEIIGVAGDAKYTSLREAAPPTVYDVYRPEGAAVVQLRTRLEAGVLAVTLRETLARTNPALRLGDVTLQSALVDNHMVRDRALALLSAFFSAVAIVLVVVGLYGVLSYSVVQRTREIGIRLALGAHPLRVIGLVLSEVGAMTTAGLVVGAVAAMFAARFVTTLLFEVNASDVWSTVVPLTCLLIACALSVVGPALRAARLDPTTALRYE